jgi:hypothetical protein
LPGALRRWDAYDPAAVDEIDPYLVAAVRRLGCGDSFEAINIFRRVQNSCKLSPLVLMGVQTMATLAGTSQRTNTDSRFFLISAVLMALVLVAGFSLQLAMGRSTFASPVSVHIHAVLFFGYTWLYVLQNALAATGSIKTHRRLGWLSAVWVPAMVVMGTYVTVAMVRRGATPFFFQPLYFLIMNPLSILTFAGFTAAAIWLRRQTQWHRRLMFCGMAVLTGPGFGRLLPMPLLIPWAGWVVFAAVMLFPLAGVIRDYRINRKVHPGWWWGISVIVVMQVAMDLIANSGVGLMIYEATTAGAPGATVPALGYPQPPS